MLGGSPPRPALQPGVHGIGALSSAPSTRSTRRPTSSTGRRRAFPPPMPGPRASISLGPRSALSFARRVPLLPHGRAQPARTSRKLLCSYSSMAPWNFSSRVLPLSYLKQQVGCPHDCALSLLLPKPTSPAPTLFPTKQQPQRARRQPRAAAATPVHATTWVLAVSRPRRARRNAAAAAATPFAASHSPGWASRYRSAQHLRVVVETRGELLAVPCSLIL
jgi:hypothetical protein